MNKYSDIEYLIKELVSRSEDAWSYFKNEYGRLIYSCINRTLSHHASQEDKDDCFMETLKRLIDHDYKGLRNVIHMNEKAFRRYLWVVSRRCTLNYIRKIKPPSLPEEILDIIPDTSRSQDMEILRRQINDIIEQKLCDQQRLVMLYLLEGLTLEEISQLMGLSLGKVFSIKKKAISEIKKFLK